ncbi:sensor histidine kinase [Streptomyces sp. 8L]|uniref:sensor histidine kinase n=1 Tax=Streptomyces sp. 8L TaxID=2877242 RepID=UPI001CD7C93B|nr:HAMP domain-containing sensor histidine kinase [Streptomyces sp. 8L]MCA1222148.1 HAMP domain-containing histidine kinase [Streptomyces sp. 8L]
MRWALVKVVLAVSVMVVLAFAVPLGLVVKEMARDRVFTNAERQAAAIGPALAITTDRSMLERAVLSTQAGSDGRMAVHVPAAGGAAATDLGARRAAVSDIRTVERVGRASISAVPGGFTLLQPTALGTGVTAVVEVYVPEADVTRGVATAWLVLAGVGCALVAGSVVFADRLGRRTVRPARRLADAAQALGEGMLGARVPEEGPPELRAAATAFNAMADQVVQLLDAEREFAADLSHRLRTPLTVLRLNAASLGDGPAADHTREAVARLEREVDTVIRTAREAKPRTTAATGAVIGCDVGEVVRQRMDFWSALAEDEDRAVRVAGIGAPVRVPVARAEMAAALDALLGNVFRHTPEGTAFAVDVHDARDTVIVLVSDAGPGIADPGAALARGNSGGRPGSTGLGLDIARRLAESTGGDVRIGRSVLGGAEVRIRLGVAAPPGSRGAGGAGQGRGVRRLGRTGHRRGRGDRVRSSP